MPISTFFARWVIGTRSNSLASRIEIVERRDWEECCQLMLPKDSERTEKLSSAFSILCGCWLFFGNGRGFWYNCLFHPVRLTNLESSRLWTCTIIVPFNRLAKLFHAESLKVEIFHYFLYLIADSLLWYSVRSSRGHVSISSCWCTQPWIFACEIDLDLKSSTIYCTRINPALQHVVVCGNIYQSNYDYALSCVQELLFLHSVTWLFLPTSFESCGSQFCSLFSMMLIFCLPEVKQKELGAEAPFSQRSRQTAAPRVCWIVFIWNHSQSPSE